MKHLNFLRMSWYADTLHLLSTFKRSDSVSSPCRCRVLPILLLCLTLGAGQMWGADQTVTLTFEGTGSYPNNSSWTCDGDASTDYNHTASGSKSAVLAVTGPAYFTYNNSLSNVKSVTLYFLRKSNSTSACTFVVQGRATTQDSWADLKSSGSVAVGNKGAWKEVTVTLDATYTGYIRVKYTCATNPQRWIDDITITYAGSSKQDLTLGLSYSPNPIILSENASSSPTLTGNTGNGTVTYSLEDVSPSGCVSINTSTGVLTPSKVGTATVRASVAETSSYNAGSKTCAVSVVKKYTVTLKDDDSALSQTTVGGSVTLPSRAGCTGYTFAGWSTTNNATWTTTAPTIINAGSYTPTDNIDLYPVYTKTETGGEPETITIFEETCGTVSSSQVVTNVSKSNWSSTGIGMEGISVTGSAKTYTSTTNLSTAPNLGMTSSTVATFTISGINTSGYSNLKLSYRLKGNGTGSPKVYGTYSVSTNAASNNSIDLTAPASESVVSTDDDLADLALPVTNNMSLTFTATDVTNKAIYLDNIKITGETAGSTTYYISEPNCCTELGSINGSFYETHPTSVVLKWDKNSNYENWEVTGSGTIGDIKTTTISADDYWTCEVTELSCNTEYEFTVTADPVNNSGYCDGSWKISGTTSKFFIEKANSGNVKDGENNTIGTFAVTGNLTEACNTTAISLTYEVTNAGYQFKAWNVHKKNDASTKVTVTNNQFYMPAYDVVVDLELEEISNPTLTPSVDAVNFGNQEISTTSSAQTISISGANLQGGVAFEITGTDASAFAVTSPASSPIAQANAEAVGGQSVQITFTPSSAKVHSATLRFTSTNATTRDVTLSGTGVNLYTVTFDKGTGICGTASSKQTSLGASVELPVATASDACGLEGWDFTGWSETNVSTETETAPTILSGNTYTPTDNITLYAVYSRMVGEPSAFNNTSGQYRIYANVGDTKYYATGTVSIQKISSTTDVEDATLYTFEKIVENDVTYFAIKTGNDYITYTGSTNLGTNTENAYKWTISTGTKGSFRVESETSGRAIIYQDYSINNNIQTPSHVFRGYSTSNVTTQGNQYFDVEIESIGTLYYHSVPSCSGKATLTYDPNGGENAPDAVEYDINDDPVVASAGTMTKVGHMFDSWNTKADGSGTKYSAGATITDIKKDMTLYAIWTANTHKVSVSSVDHGTIKATPAGASEIAEGGNNAAVAYGTVVSLVQENDTHFTFGTWSVMAGETPVAVENDQFTMPDADVTISATFTENAKRDVVFYSNGTQVGEKVTTYVGEAPATAPTAVYESCLEGSNQFYGWATEEWTGAITSTAGKMVYTGALPDVEAGEGDVEFYAIWAKGTATPSNSYAAITSGLAEDNYVIAYSYNGGTQIVLTNAKDGGTSDTQLEGEAPSLSDSKYVTTEGKYIWELQAQNDGSYYIYNAASEKYLNATTTALSMSTTQTKFTITYDETNSRWTIQLKDNDSYYMHGYVSGTSYDFRVSESGSGYKYRTYLYKNEKEISYSDFRTNCCSLKPVTNVQVGTIGETSVELTWTAPTSKTGINKYQIVDAEHEIAQDVTDVDATSATVTGLTECTTYNFKVVSVGDDCSSNSNEVEATPFAGAKVVTFDYNGGSGATTSASTSCGVATVNLPTPNARDGYNFKGWNDGTQTLAPSTATFTPAATMTLTAQWAQLYTVHYEFAGASGAPEDAQYEAGATVELPSEPNKGFLAPFEAWDYSEAVTMVDETHFTMPAKNLTITATYDEIIGQWILVTDESQLVANSYVIIAAADYDYAMSTTQEDDYRGRTGITKSGSTLTNPSENVQIFTLEAGTAEGSWAFKTLNGTANNYIYPAGGTGNSPKNYLRSKDKKDDNASWVLDLENGKATAVGNSATNKILSHNSSANRFSCYGSIQTAIAFYQFREGVFYDINMPASAPTGGTVSANTSMEKAGETVTLTYKPSRGYTVKTLTVTGATSGSIAITPALEAGVTEYTFTMPSEAVTVAASFEAVPPVEYHMVENASDIPMGMQFVMLGTKADGSEPYVIGEMNNSNRLAGDAVEASAIDAVNKTLSLTTEAAVDYTMDGETGAFKIKYNNQYLEAGSSNTVRWSNTGDAWTIAISDGKATITSGAYKLNYNPSQHWVAAYTNAQQPVALYALPYTTYNFVLDGCKTIKVVTGYTYTYTIKNTDEPTSKPGDNYTFLHKWTDGINTYAVGDAVEVSAAKTLQPCWKVTPTANVDINTLPTSVTEIVVEDGKTLTIGADRNLDNLTVEAGGKVELAENKLTVVGTFTIETTMASGNSGQLNGATASNFEAGEAYIDITLGDNGNPEKWHAFTVPFPVDALNGIFDLNNNKLTNEVNYAIMDYHGDIRATGNYGWKKFRGIMTPGTFYLMTVDGERTTYRFKKTANGALVAENTMDLKEYAIEGNGEDGIDNGWNGVGNPTLRYGQVGYPVQVLNPTSYTYEPLAANAKNFIVGTPFFIQANAAAATADMTFGAASGSANYAPARTPASEIKDIEVSFGNEEYSDRLYISASEDALNQYETGKDLAKMTMTNTPSVAQIFGKAYNTKLCMVYAPLSNDQAVYDLTLYAPQAGEYTIAAPSMDNADLYLTYEGSIIWNLSMSEYVADFAKGNNEGYGLLLVRKAPNAATGVDEVTGDKVQCTKVVIDDHVYILRGEQLYGIDGKMVK